MAKQSGRRKSSSTSVTQAGADTKTRPVQSGPAGSRRAALAEQRAAKERAQKVNRVVTMVLAAVLAVAVVTVVVIAFRSTAPAAQTAGGGQVQGAGSDLLVRADSHRLSNPASSKATFVEFLDFECEACRAAFPTIERLRQTYGDRVTFVVRYFPIPSHFNAERAARAVEAAAQQSQFEAMYKKMYETQTEWGEQQVPMDARFRSYAQQLGLELAKWDTDYNSPATLARIKADVADAEKLGVNSTPTFFLNGQRLKPESAEQLTQAIEKAINGQ